MDLGFCLTVHSVQGQTLDRAILVLGRQIGRSIGKVSWSLLYVALSRVRELSHLRFFPCGRRGSTECFTYLTTLKKPANFVKWLDSYVNGIWDPTILQQKQIAMENAIESKFSALGRDGILSQRKDVLLGYLKALGYGGLYSLKRGGLQRKLVAHMVEKQIWEPAKGKIERPTKRRSSKKKKPVFKQMKHVDLASQNNTAKSKKKKKTTDCLHDIGNKNSSVVNAVHGVTLKKSSATIKKKKFKYVPKLVKIPDYPPMYTRYNPGRGNCFFYGLEQGLQKLGVTFLNEEEIRENLADWFQLETNQMQMEAHIGGRPSSFIGQLPDTGLFTPAEGWESYLAGKDWGWWGEHIRKKGTWVGVLEVPIINQMLDNIGLDVVVIVFDQ